MFSRLSHVFRTGPGSERHSTNCCFPGSQTRRRVRVHERAEWTRACEGGVQEQVGVLKEETRVTGMLVWSAHSLFQRREKIHASTHKGSKLNGSSWGRWAFDLRDPRFGWQELSFFTQAFPDCRDPCVGPGAWRSSLGILGRGAFALNVALCSPRTFSERCPQAVRSLH